MKKRPIQPVITWGQLLTRGMSPEIAGIVMGVPAGIAEWELRRAANAMSAEQRQMDKAALFLQSNCPTLTPRPRASLI